MKTNAVPSAFASSNVPNPAFFTASAVMAFATVSLSLLTAAASFPTCPKSGSAIATASNFFSYFFTAAESSSYSAPCIKCVGWITRFFTPFFTALSSACSMLSIFSPSRAFTWFKIICAVKALLTDHEGFAFAIALSTPPMSAALLSLNDVPNETTRISFSPILSWLSGLSFEASPVSLPK